MLSLENVRNEATLWPCDRPQVHKRFVTTAIAVLLMLMISTMVVQAADPISVHYRSDLASDIDRRIEQRLPAWLAYYRDLHAHPELSSHERETSRKMAARLADSGYKVISNVGGHGVVGVLANGPGPTVLIRGDMDALPVTEETNLPYASKIRTTGAAGQSVGVMHACGHDMHQTCLAASAEVLSSLRESWAGTIVIVAQPAEEIGTGARLMIEDGLFDRVPRPDYCLALHVSADRPAGTVAYAPGWALANVDSVDITVKGKGGHGSRPQQAIDPIVAAAHVIVALQTIVSRRVDPLEPAVITVGSIHAGATHNIISNEARMQLTVRSYTERTRRVLLDGIRQVTMDTCRALGCQEDPDVVIREGEFTPSTYNDPELADAAAKVWRHAIGKERVSAAKPVMGGEDFGRYPKHLGVPGLIYWLGSVKPSVYEASLKPGGQPLPSLHSSMYTPDPEPTIQSGVKSMASIALALLKESR